ncbi:MAG: hypothetical protein V4543_13080 [Bacteroidota bacterium]
MRIPITARFPVNSFLRFKPDEDVRNNLSRVIVYNKRFHELICQFPV